VIPVGDFGTVAFVIEVLDTTGGDFANGEDIPDDFGVDLPGRGNLVEDLTSVVT